MLNYAPHGGFPWCGLLINMIHLDVLGDYSRISETHAANTITVNFSKTPGTSLLNKMLLYIKPKMHPIFTDEAINRKETVLLNIYQNMVNCAIKFTAYSKQLTKRAKVNCCFMIKALREILHYSFIVYKSKQESNLCLKFDTLFTVKKNEIIWIGLIAFQRILDGQQEMRFLKNQVTLWLQELRLKKTDNPLITKICCRRKSSDLFKVKY